MKRVINMFLALCLITMISCEQESSQPLINKKVTERTSLEDQPSLIQIVNDLRKNFSESTETIEALDRANWSNVLHYKGEEDGKDIFSMTFRGNTKKEGYYDNLVISGSRNNPKAYIVRYQPVEGWFDDYSLNGNMGAYEGEIIFMDLNKNIYAQTYRSDNPLIRTSRSSTPLPDQYCTEVTFTIVISCPTLPGEAYCSEFSEVTEEVCFPVINTIIGEDTPGGPTPPGPGIGAGGGQGDPILPNEDELEDEPCLTGDPVLDHSMSVEIFQHLWKQSNVTTTTSSGPIINMRSQRSEAGGWLVKESNGRLKFWDLEQGWVKSSCGLLPPSQGYSPPTLELGETIIGFIHTHPFFEGENISGICSAPDATSYTSGFSDDDKLKYVEFKRRSGSGTNFNLYLIDGNNLTTYNGITETSYTRCGY